MLPMNKTHIYNTIVTWTGNKGSGTSGYRDYERDHIVAVPQKVDLACSSDPSFRGDPTRHNPEELFLSSISSCHMLWYLHLCATAGVVVMGYEDSAVGTMVETSTGAGYFERVKLRPKVTIKDKSMEGRAIQLHKEAGKYCFIANSIKCIIEYEVDIVVKH